MGQQAVPDQPPLCFPSCSPLASAVIAISASDTQTGCWSWYEDSDGAAAVLRSWIKEWGLDGLPLYVAGASSGASFALKMPRLIKVGGWGAAGQSVFVGGGTLAVAVVKTGNVPGAAPVAVACCWRHL